MTALVPGSRIISPRFVDPTTPFTPESFYVVATERSISDPSAQNYHLARIVDGRAVRAAMIASGAIVPRAARAPGAEPAVLRTDYWGLLGAADDIFVEFNEGVDDDRNANGLERKWLEEIIARPSTNVVVAARLRALVDGDADDWPAAKERRFDEQRAMREEFCAKWPEEIEAGAVVEGTGATADLGSLTAYERAVGRTNRTGQIL